MTHKPENNYITEVLSRSESSEPHIRHSQPGSLDQEEEPSEHLVLKDSGFTCRRPTGLWETETPLLEGAPKVLGALGPRAEQ